VSILAVVIALDNFNRFASQLYTVLNFKSLMLQAYQLAMFSFRCRGTETLPLFTTDDKFVSSSLLIRTYPFPSPLSLLAPDPGPADEE
jgi:hypothetical protein